MVAQLPTSFKEVVMQVRRIVGAVVLLALVGMVFPAPSQALDVAQVGADVEPGIFARLLEWAQGVFAEVTEVFVAEEGASIGPDG